jgi:tetratricopeptide (TPR) repeat protein
MANEALERVREHVDPRWSRAKVERELAVLEERVSARAPWRMALWGGSALAGAAALALLFTLRTPEGAAPQVVAPVAPAPVAQAPAPVEPAAPVEPFVAPVEAAPQLAVEVEASEASTEEAAPHKRRPHGRRTKVTRSRVVMAGQAWQSLAREGRYHEAYRALEQDKLDREHSAVDDLLLAGDAARLSGHPREAVPYYRDALARAGKGSRAHLAAFTLGRTLLHELKDARGAADAFARAYAAAPAGPLAEEALAGEVESWARAGDRARTRAAAQRYLQAFPKGRRAKDMERFGGAE